MSVETELWTRTSGDIRPSLPRSAAWESFDDHVELDGGGWLLSVGTPEPVDAADVPQDIARLLDGVAFRVAITVEPISPPEEAWALLDEVMSALGRALGGAALDPRTGRPVSWG